MRFRISSFKHFLFMPRGFVDELVRGAIRRKDQAVLRPLTKLMIRTTTAMTNKRWIRLPAMWKLKPRSQRIKRMTKIVQSICSSYAGCQTPIVRLLGNGAAPLLVAKFTHESAASLSATGLGRRPGHLQRSTRSGQAAAK